MATIGDQYLREQLEVRRQRLLAAMVDSPQSHALDGLLQEVDEALGRMEKGTFGICESCHESIEKESLLANPLVRFCLDHLSAAERRALQDDLDLASQIQQKLLPAPHVRSNGWEAHYHYQPAGLVSGDYCDLILPENGDGELVFVVGDVSGKGVAASLLMTHLHAMFRSLTSVGLPLDQRMSMVNRVFCESTIAGQYATLMCGHACHGGQIEISGAGHLPGLIVHKGGVTEVAATGLPLGMFCNSQYESRKIQLQVDDSLILYTDGLSEVSDPSGCEYGERRLTEFLSTQHALAPKDLTAACLEDLRRFSAGPRPADDLTLMAIRRAA